MNYALEQYVYLISLLEHQNELSLYINYLVIMYNCIMDIYSDCRHFKLFSFMGRAARKTYFFMTHFLSCMLILL